MKKFMLVTLGSAMLIAAPVFADTMTHSNGMCKKHCNLMDLEEKVKTLKSHASTADKIATKEHLQKDIEAYKKKLQEIKKELDATK